MSHARRERYVNFIPGDDTIKIEGYPHPISELHVKPHVTEDGGLWFKIKEEEDQGEDIKYRRWDILEKALRRLLFDED